MPTYEYICESCGHAFEAFQSISAEPIRSCPECGKTVRRKIGAGVGLLFRGSGFYITDYKKNNGNVKKDTEGESKKDSNAKSETAQNKGQNNNQKKKSTNDNA